MSLSRPFAIALLALLAALGAAISESAAAFGGPTAQPPVPAALVSRVDRTGPSAAVGTIVGTVEMSSPPGRQTLNRYQGRTSSQAPRPFQDPPPVAFLNGSPGGVGWDPGEPVVLAQSDTTFVPTVVMVPVGGTVEFPNEDGFFHNVFSYSEAKRFDLGRYPQGETKEVVFERAGIVQVFCEVHDHMRAAIVVTSSPFHAIVSDDLMFTITGVPAGSYLLTVWHADAGRRDVPVEVTEGGTTEITVTL